MLQYFFSYFLSFLLFLFDLLDEDRELRLGVTGQLLRVAVLNVSSSIEDQNFVTVDDSVDSVSNSEYSGVLERLVHEVLDLLFCDNVDVGSGLIQEHNAVVSEDSSADANELLFTFAQIVSADLEIDTKTVRDFFNVKI